MRDLLEAARSGGYAVGYFETWDLYSLEAALRAAEAARAPAILGFGGATTSSAWYDSGGIEMMALAARSLAERSSVPTVVLYNEARTPEQLERGMEAGCNAVMLGTAHLGLEENIRVTRELVRTAHRREVDVEAELGHLADALDAEALEARTDPLEAERFVRETGVDALAVSVGTAHCHTDVVAGATVDTDRIREIGRRVRVPLVLHGGSGLPEAAARVAIAAGIAKMNYGTRLKRLWLEGIREALAALESEPNVQRAIGSREASDILAPATRRIQAQIRDLIRVYGAEGRAP